MGQLHGELTDTLRAFIERQQLFFVATAPLAADGHVNVSPKGVSTLRVVGPREVVYLDYVGSGVETIAHLRENGRIVLMVSAFEGPPKIVRLHGKGRVLEPADQEFVAFRPLFPVEPAGRAIIHVTVERISDSCGYGVPLLAFEKQRTQLVAWADRKGPKGLSDYQTAKNSASIDGLPALRAVSAADVREAGSDAVNGPRKV